MSRDRLFRRRGPDGRPTGPWIAWGYDAQGRRWSESTRQLDKKAAEATARELEREHASPAAAAAAKATLADAVKLLLDDRNTKARVGTRSAATAAFYVEKSGHWRRILGDGFRLAELTAPAVDRVIDQRREEGASEHTIAKEVVALRCALKLAVRAGLWHGLHEAVLPVGLSPAYEPRTRTLRPDELQRLLGELAPEGAPIVAFIVATGARWSEAAGALRADVGPVTATPALVRLRGTKTAAANRVVPVLHPTCRELLAYAVEHARGGEGGRLFGTWKSPNNALRRACERAKIAHASFNDLRRTFTTWHREAGVSAELLAPTLGHTTTAMVQRVYGRLSAEALAASIGAAFRVGSTAADMQQSGCTSVDSVRSLDASNSAKEPVFREFLVGHEGLEPSANGLRVRHQTPAKRLWPRPKRTRKRPGAADIQQPGAATKGRRG